MAHYVHKSNVNRCNSKNVLGKKKQNCPKKDLSVLNAAMVLSSQFIISDDLEERNINRSSNNYGT